MKIKLLSRMASPEGNHAPGEILDIDKIKALVLITAGYAEAVDPEVNEMEIEEKPKTIEKNDKTNKRR